MTENLAEPINPTGITLTDLAHKLGVQYEGPEVRVTSVTSASDIATDGALFVALPGAKTHGAEYADRAAKAGATAALTDETGAERTRAAGLATLVHPAPREIMGEASRAVYHTDAAATKLIGVTGTNGKTTTTYLLQALFNALELRSGLSGTVERRVGDEGVETRESGRLTTPEADYLHGLVARMGEEEVEVAAIEVSAQAITHHRIDGLLFDVAIFTNLSQDHLDDYGTLDNYFNAKLPLFTPEHAARGITLIDDEWGQKLAREATIPMTTVSGNAEADADWHLKTEELDLEHTAFDLVHRDGRTFHATVNQPGWFVALDAALSVIALTELGHDLERIEKALGQSGEIDANLPGRLDLVNPDGNGPRVYVDYGHTPESFRVVLSTLRGFTEGRLFMIFGADGDRDATKRPDMARSAALADVVVVTDYNPRFEDPDAIRATLMQTLREEFPDVESYEIADSAEGIDKAVSLATSQDIIFVGGHGHRKDVEVAGKLIPYSVKDAVRQALKRHGFRC
ncbi:Mur ligase family protein [Gulosibacter molinativorax]|uniref:UDP-N-acetylmuramoyl-L-alanyl-D-glutamate--2, 6-diaminopimelate ligase n=1 Tax=Gulosibacter molinativorax TaxID=256821 RepID=A0ABT7CA81_9MICO|nr:UDP-N-acetylmuramyl-tripeptide synthetase [Gulosibacter molinativorax]MDJ1372114.1 UDP-N-acetylmuramoyl-L-alanyl-D-glutamate--2,6-diaminopimelate ligase [Gulosibacter molinativorax]QUY62341.1 UDP-N-acetylmuramyl-tripeptide synthetase [Gulosibacter molinativorax]